MPNSNHQKHKSLHTPSNKDLVSYVSHLVIWKTFVNAFSSQKYIYMYIRPPKTKQKVKKMKTQRSYWRMHTLTNSLQTHMLHKPLENCVRNGVQRAFMVTTPGLFKRNFSMSHSCLCEAKICPITNPQNTPGP